MHSVFIFLLLLATGFGEDKMKGCLEKDSISCVQLEMFRSVRSFFEQDSMPLFAGLSFVKSSAPDAAARSLSSDSLAESNILSAPSIEKKDDVLESYVLDKAANFFQERSLSWNLAPVVQNVATTARSLYQSLPDSVKENVSELVEEGRGKKKKLKKLLPLLLIGLKMKMAVFLVLTYFIVALIAKKAILASIISLAISGFIAIKKLLSSHQMPVHQVEYSAHGGSSGWSSGGASSGWDSGHGSDSHGSYSNNVAHSLAYGAQKPTR
ncbi:uncharacterized protein LOC111055834 [Nilaparvata lugens]|uniref:uncharacterized protein LOC111055834 n=1 Tax=Nilaparvata lugens TaxID=108931 RepID=UPI00193E5FB3|nr:uncharacterized protein LOC111055834 [Nilaparvata lugens]